jgi:hypothetical protein
MRSMTRRLAVLAWVAATVVSVAVSTAAVARVRAQVTERPAVVSIATLRRATTTTIAQALSETRSTLPRDVPSTTTVVADTTTTTRASVEATPATTVETLPPPATDPPATQPPPDDDDDRGGEDDDRSGQPATETRTFRGGTVTVSYDGSALTLVSATPEDGYELDVEEQSAERIVVRFFDEGRSSVLVAQIVRGRLQMRVFD